MSKFRIYVEDGVLPLAHISALEQAIGESVDADVTLAVECIAVDEEEIRTLNASQRGVDKVTDVLSFPTLDGILGKKICKKDFPYDMDEEGNLLIGSIAICEKRAREQAEEYGHSYERELHYLLVHGVMHCLGYDHIEDADKAQMREKEETVLKKLGIVRSEI
ncbi:MAG: rRNA maturation RNase YbeY [Clostridia bacterium]|nr:rRNA maturation RNase YbeY [Clostridia bacterium]